MSGGWKELWEGFTGSEGMLASEESNADTGHLRDKDEWETGRINEIDTYKFTSFSEDVRDCFFTRDIFSDLAKSCEEIQDFLNHSYHLPIHS